MLAQVIASLIISAGVAHAQYLEPGVCASCHKEIADRYARTGMARSFGAIRDPVPPGNFQHQASQEMFDVYERAGKPHLKRHQTGFDGAPANVLEMPIDYQIGSGAHARSYISRTRSGELVELPLTRYTEKGGYWAMSPAYDRPDHAGFSRRITYRCMFCHNAYPQIETGADRWDNASRLPERLPNGIDCQRCHGPGRDHVNAVREGKSIKLVRGAIVNPARLESGMQMEICLQCHLETTNLRLPSQLLRYGRGVFSYWPGEPLGDYMLHFDHAPGTDRDGKFEFSSAPYRLRKSACFLKSAGALTCTTCHDPHSAAQAGSVACKQCHATAIESRVRLQLHPASDDCVACHMPQRRPSDAIHVTVTDHYIQKRPERVPEPDVEHHDGNTPPYRGEVALYYPPSLPKTAETELYLAIAQVKQRSNLTGGLARLEAAVAKYAPARGEFYFELAEAYRRSGQLNKAIASYREGASRGPADWHFLYGLGTTLLTAGDAEGSLQALKNAQTLAPKETAVLQALAETLSQQGKLPDAITTWNKALEIDPASAEIENNLGTALARSGDNTAAERALREAVRLQPQSAAMRVNLAALLARGTKFPEAKYNFEAALRIDPGFAEGHSAYGTALASNGHLVEAREQYEAALRLNPGLSVTRNNLGALLLRLGDVEGAIREYRAAVEARPDSPVAHYNLALALAAQGKLAEAENSLRTAIRYAPDYFEAHLKLGQMLATRRESADARVHLRKAAESPDATVRNAAAVLLASLM